MPPFLIGRGSAGALTTLVGVGILLIMPELIAQMKKAIGVKDGVFTQLAKEGIDNFGKNYRQGGGLGPVNLGIGAAGTLGMVQGGHQYLKSKNTQFDLGQMIGAMAKGYTPPVAPGKTAYTYGGFVNTAFNARKKLNSIRSFGERLSGKGYDSEKLSEGIADAMTNKNQGSPDNPPKKDSHPRAKARRFSPGRG